jgi:hypothetical protein
MRDRPLLEVLIAGGGCAALEAMFRLQRIAGSNAERAYALHPPARPPTGHRRGCRAIATHPEPRPCA